MSNEASRAGPDVAFQTRIADGRLWLQHCRDCGRAVFYPRILCPGCGSTDLDWRPASGRGTVYSRAAILRRPIPPAVDPARHVLILVDLAEGVRMMSSLPDTRPDRVVIGMAVRARIIGEEGARMVVFDPALPDGGRP